MKTCLVALLCCVTLTAMLAYAQGGDEGFQPARVVAFERIPADAQHMENADGYKISMRMGDTIYACRAYGSASTFMDWSPGKEFPAKLNDKILLVKSPNGQMAELKVVGKKAPK